LDDLICSQQIKI